MPFLTTPTIPLSCLASAAPKADSWWLGHVVTDDVVILDTGGQALDIFLHGPETAHKNGILKTFTHTSIPTITYPPMHTPKANKEQNTQLTKENAFICPLPVQCDGGRWPGSLADVPSQLSPWSRVCTQEWSTPIHPCTLLKETKSKTLNLPNMSPLLSCPLPVQCVGGRRPGSLADALQDSFISNSTDSKHL